MAIAEHWVLMEEGDPAPESGGGGDPTPESAPDPPEAAPDPLLGGDPTPDPTPAADPEPTPDPTPADPSKPEWFNQLPEELRGMTEASEIAGLDQKDLAERHLKLSSAFGNKVGVPGKGATQEDWDKFHTAIGRPENAEGYDFTQTENIDKIVPEDDLKKAAELFHEAGLSKRQAATVMDQFAQMVSKASETQQQETAAVQNEWVNQLQAEYGDDFTPRINAAKKLLQEKGSPELAAKLAESGLGSFPPLVKFIVGIATDYAEDHNIIGTGPGRQFQMSRSEARDSVEKMRLDKEFGKRLAAGDEEAVERFRKAHELAFPGVTRIDVGTSG